MKIAVFSDIHGNRQALTAILEDIKKENIDDVICLGDVIGVGPNPKECMDLIIDNNIEMVLGNHELYFLKGIDIDDEIGEDEAKHHNWVREQITEIQKKYLQSCFLTLEKDYCGKKVLFEHFLVDNNSKDEYPFYGFEIIRDGSINQIVDELNYDLIFIGHEHNNFSIGNKLYDVGSAGCRKDDNTRYIVFDTDNFNVWVRTLKYDRKSFEEDLLKYEYPERNLIAKWSFGIEDDVLGAKKYEKL